MSQNFSPEAESSNPLATDKGLISVEVYWPVLVDSD